MEGRDSNSGRLIRGVIFNNFPINRVPKLVTFLVRLVAAKKT